MVVVCFTVHGNGNGDACWRLDWEEKKNKAKNEQVEGEARRAKGM